MARTMIKIIIISNKDNNHNNKDDNEYQNWLSNKNIKSLK